MLEEIFLHKKISRCHIFLNLFQITERKAWHLHCIRNSNFLLHQFWKDINNKFSKLTRTWLSLLHVSTTQIIPSMHWLSFHLQLVFSTFHWFDKQIVFAKETKTLTVTIKSLRINVYFLRSLSLCICSPTKTPIF